MEHLDFGGLNNGSQESSEREKLVKIDVTGVKKYVFLNFVEKYLRLKWKKEVNVIITSIIEYAQIFQNVPKQQDSIYVSDLNMPNFWIWQSSECGRVVNMRALHSVVNMTEYAMIDFWNILGSKYAKIHYIAGFWICKSYTGI